MPHNIYTELLSPEQDPQVIDFLDRLGATNPSVLAYHYPFYQQMLSQLQIGQPLYWGAWSNSQLVGLLPGFIRRTELGLVYSSLPFFGPNAGVICAEDSAAAEIHTTLLSTVLEFLNQQPDCLSASFYTPFKFERFDYYDRALPSAYVLPKFTQYLSIGEADSLDSKLQWDIRKAQKSGVMISSQITPENVDAFWEIYQQNCLDYNIPLKPRTAIAALVETGISSGRVRCYWAWHEAKMIAGLMMLWSPQTASYYLPCSLTDARHLQPGTALVDFALRDARQQGIQYWNWESSPSRESGVYRFKQKWGSQEQAYRIYVVPFRAEEDYQRLGKIRMGCEFPYFFVYDYNRL